MDVATLHQRCVAEWQRRLQSVRPEQWDNPTPCSEWNVRSLVNHIVNEEMWTRPLLEGATIEDVGDRFDGDLLGDDPIATGTASSTDALNAVDKHVVEETTVHLSFGDIPNHEYVRQLSGDHLIHSWDLAMGTGQDPTMDAELVAAIGEWFAPMEEWVRQAGVIAAHPDITGDAQTELLAAYGRRSDWQRP
jgi:uncharacterized protein (TIGR03086 family)